LKTQELVRRPKVDVHHFNLLNKLTEQNLAPTEYDHTQNWGTGTADSVIHNYEDRSAHEIISSDRLYLAHFLQQDRDQREASVPGADAVLSHFEERHRGLSTEAAPNTAIVIGIHITPGG
jgi:hypothetical protein